MQARALLDQAEAAYAAGVQFSAFLYLMRVMIEDLEALNAAGTKSGELKPYTSTSLAHGSAHVHWPEHESADQR
jgi:hypothetical protein